MTLAGRRALVTGGGSGIGATVALRLAEAGARVWIAGRSRAPLEAVAAGREAISAITADVTDEASVDAMFRAIGPVEMVVASAGAGESARLGETSLELWHRMIDANLTSTFLTFRAAAARMPAGGGRLVAIASTAALRGDPYVSAYTAAKHGVLGLCRALAAELGGRGVTVNAVCPGFVDSPMTDRNIANIAGRTGLSEAEARARLAAANPGGRLIRPEEVADTVLWLCGDGAALVNGQAIAVAGGRP